MARYIPWVSLGRLTLLATLVFGHSVSAAEAAPLLPALPTLPPPPDQVILQIKGQLTHMNVGDEAHFDFSLLADLPEHQVVTSTSVTDGPQVFEGVLMRDLMLWVGAQGDTVEASALNDYIIDIPMSDFEEYDVLLAHTMNGERLSARDKGPLWIVYPRDEIGALQDIRYDYRWVWQLQTLEVR